MKFWINHPGKLTRTVLGHLKAAAAANTQLRVLALRFSAHVTETQLNSFFQKLRARGDTVSRWQLLESPSLPEQIRSALGISISQLSFAGQNLFHHFLKQHFSRISEEISWEKVEILWNAVFPTPSVDAACSFAIVFISSWPYIPFSTLKQKSLAEWIVLKATAAFRAIDLHVAPLDRFSESLFGVLSLAAFYEIDAKEIVGCAFEFASLHHPASPFSFLARTLLDHAALYQLKDVNAYAYTLDLLFEYAKMQQKKIRLFEDHPSRSAPLEWPLFL
eukprot:TRINITY_DN13895_c0_g1_i1.p1 TRINITY_DN13895_c0_g1~~TRINITY_DN13895_c0_g1_i1.p1  ORF type:complete len:276 (-),score=44.55 TRINITY_DN13895_c0_g1_i1:50-877(-)